MQPPGTPASASVSPTACSPPVSSPPCLAPVLPGPGTIYLRQSLKFRAPVKIGHTVCAIVRNYRFEPAPEKRHPAHHDVMVKEDVVIDGEAIVLVPTRD